MLLHLDELSIDHYLVELRFHNRDELVQNIAEREVGAVSLKEGPANRRPGGAVKNELRSKNADRVGYIAEFSTRETWCRRRGGERGSGFAERRSGSGFYSDQRPSRSSRAICSPARSSFRRAWFRELNST